MRLVVQELQSESPMDTMAASAQPGAAAPATKAELADVLCDFRTESGRTMLELVDESPVLLMFLRHFGCAFCRQTLDQVSQIRNEIAVRGVRPVFVHLGTPERAKPFFDYYQLTDVERVSNPEGTFYRHPVFHLWRQPVYMQLFSPKVWKGWLGGALKKYGVSSIEEDGQQMPGVFFLKERKIANVFHYRTIADEPDYLKLIG
jgi:peroxiredoxin